MTEKTAGLHLHRCKDNSTVNRNKFVYGWICIIRYYNCFWTFIITFSYWIKYKMCLDFQHKTKELMWTDTLSDSIVICSTLSKLRGLVCIQFSYFQD